MDPIIVSCRCPGKHPDGDSIVLREKLTFEGGMTLLVLMSGDTDDLTQVAERGARVAGAMVAHGVESWNVVDEAEKPVRPGPSAVKAWLGSFDDSLIPLINAAYAQYEGAVMRPLAPTNSSSRNGGRTATASTSRSRRPARSRP